jgi:hypothetical protein
MQSTGGHVHVCRPGSWTVKRRTRYDMISQTSCVGEFSFSNWRLLSLVVAMYNTSSYQEAAKRNPSASLSSSYA